MQQVQLQLSWLAQVPASKGYLLQYIKWLPEAFAERKMDE
jgi:hypothetical protein